MHDQAGDEWDDDCIHACLQSATPQPTNSSAGFRRLWRYLPQVGRKCREVCGTSCERTTPPLDHSVRGVSSVQGSVSGNVAGSVASVAGNVAGDVVRIGQQHRPGASPPPHLRRTLFRRRPFSVEAAQRWRMRYSIENLAGGDRVIHVTSRNALRGLRNRVRNQGGTLSIYEDDDTTIAWTAATTTAAGDPMTELDPT